LSFTFALKEYCKRNGADLAGITDLEPFRRRLPTLPENLLKPYLHAISVAIHLDDRIIAEISDSPTPEYAQHYRAVNNALDSLTAQIVRWIHEKGFSARTIPASHIIDETNLLGNISHRAVARMAGLGWQGKSLLIINPEFGPRIRLATVLTDMPLDADQPLENSCGKCTACVKACPASAIKNASTNSYYDNREIALDLARCHQKLLEFKALPGIGHMLCGICIVACPYGN